MLRLKAAMSLWETATELENQHETLAAGISADVCVIGAGIAGLTAAGCLLREGKSVVVLDAARPGSGETARTTAHLVTALDRGWSEIVDVHGRDLARLAAESHRRAIDWIEETAHDEGIACDFERVDGYLLAGEHGDPSRLDSELEAARAAGVPGVEKVAEAPRIGLPGPCLRFPRQAQFHPLRYLAGLEQAAAARGARLFSRARATRVSGDQPLWVEIADGPPVMARAVIVATNTPFNYRVATHTKQAAYQSYVSAFRWSGTAGPALWWDLEEPFHYVRTYRPPEGGELVLVGGEDHKTGQPERAPAECHHRLEAWARRHLPGLGEVVDRWSGEVMESMDGLGLIGRVERDREVFIATGDSGNGMTHGTIAGMLLADLVVGRRNAWADVYDPTRIRLRAVGRFARENLNVAARYASWLARGTTTRAEEIAAGSGAVVRRGLTPIAVYRDAAGRLHERSAVCPHLGCIVAWNEGPGTWDCPCHGSRFAATGEVVHGPAQRGLTPVESGADAPPSDDGAPRPQQRDEAGDAFPR